MKKENEVIHCISQVAEKMLTDKQNIENYAAKLGYSIDLTHEFNERFRKNVCNSFRVLNYIYNEPSCNYCLRLGKQVKLPENLLFAMCNTELYYTNKVYHIIEKVNSKKLSIKVSEGAFNTFEELLSLFEIKIKEVELHTKKRIYFFDEPNFYKTYHILMYSNEYTDKAIFSITEKEKTMYKEHCTYPEILSNFMSGKEIEDNYKYINKYLLKLALMSK